MINAFWDSVGFLIVSFTIGAFFFWLVAYLVVEVVRYVLFGPSDQLRSVGTSILDEPPLNPSPQKPVLLPIGPNRPSEPRKAA